MSCADALQAAVFDMDGTLLESMHIWKTAGVEYLAALGIEAEPDLHSRIKHLDMADTARYFQKVYRVPLSVPELVEGMNRHIDHQYLQVLQLKAGAADFLRRLKERGVKLCLATATDRYMAEGALKRCGVLSLFDGFLTCSEVGRGKHDPAIFEAALRCLGTERSATWVFEDSLYAVRTAKAAGFPVAVVDDVYSHGDRAELKALANQYLYQYSDFRME